MDILEKFQKIIDNDDLEGIKKLDEGLMSLLTTMFYKNKEYNEKSNVHNYFLNYYKEDYKTILETAIDTNNAKLFEDLLYHQQDDEILYTSLKYLMNTYISYRSESERSLILQIIIDKDIDINKFNKIITLMKRMKIFHQMKLMILKWKIITIS